MKDRAIIPAAALTLALFAAPTAFAQFEGVVEMKMTSAQSNGTVKTWVSKIGTRSEMEMQVAEGKRSGMGSGMKMVTLLKFAEPDVMTFVNDSNKTYSVVNTKEMREAARGTKHEEETYTVEKLGKDTVAGFACQNAVVKSSKGTRMEVCVSNEILGGGSLIRSLQQRGGNGGGALVKAMKDAGLDGYPIRIVMQSSRDERGTTKMELVSAKRQAVAASTFEVPAGYKKSDMFMPMSNPELDRKIKEALERMTPEQRKAYEELMKKQSGGH